MFDLEDSAGVVAHSAHESGSEHEGRGVAHGLPDSVELEVGGPGGIVEPRGRVLKERPSVIRQLGIRAQNGFDESRISEAEPAQFVDHPRDADLVFLVDRDQRTLVAVVGDSEMGDERSQNAAVVDPDAAIFEPECRERRRGRGDQLDLGERRSLTDDVDVALDELAKPALLGPLSPPHWCDLNRAENLRQLRLMRRVEPRERHRQIEA